MSRDARHRIKFDPQRIVGFILGGCGGVECRSARADWSTRTCNASLRGADDRGARAARGARRAAAGAAASPAVAASDHPAGLLRGRCEGAPQYPPADAGHANEITRD
ncbi:hypothetical protein K1T71_001523 [Dendrolimus kikuchii]|uniref:Uncharacterized protein n=1 Tax=Dendrolimus kikuchii TaxID=765133 RepID=A0ACC1DJH9_9NEOP|nr:hypothetical protein K1T71_001523 [Dendrolimus kikuchii]